jgi:hypothetical protein
MTCSNHTLLFLVAALALQPRPFGTLQFFTKALSQLAVMVHANSHRTFAVLLGSCYALDCATVNLMPHQAPNYVDILLFSDRQW